jgi:hypothetical protein
VLGPGCFAYCKEAKVPFIITTAQSAAITEEKGHRYVFRISTNTDTYTRSIANGAAKLWGGKKVFIIGPDYEYGHKSKADFMEAYTKLVPDAKIVGELWPKLVNMTEAWPQDHVLGRFRLCSGAEMSLRQATWPSVGLAKHCADQQHEASNGKTSILAKLGRISLLVDQ